MLIEYLNGELLDMDPKLAALDAAIYRALRKHGPTKQAHLWYRVAAKNYGLTSQLDPAWPAAIERLVSRRLVICSVQRRNSFLLRIPSRAERERITQEGQQ
jgi:hypothetical protein